MISPDIVRALRKASGKTSSEAAAIVGVTSRTWVRYENEDGEGAPSNIVELFCFKSSLPFPSEGVCARRIFGWPAIVSVAKMMPGVGATRLAIDLGRVYERSGLRVLLVDADGAQVLFNDIAPASQSYELHLPKVMSRLEFEEALEGAEVQSPGPLRSYDIVLVDLGVHDVGFSNEWSVAKATDLFVVPAPLSPTPLAPVALRAAKIAVGRLQKEFPGYLCRILVNNMGIAPNYEDIDHAAADYREGGYEMNGLLLADLRDKYADFLMGSFQTTAFEMEDQVLARQALQFGKDYVSHIDAAPRGWSAFEIENVAREIAAVVDLPLSR